MKYAVIAAGEGSRLAQEGVMVAKPFVKIHGEALLERLVRLFRDNEATDVVVALREKKNLPAFNLSVTTICCSTPSSMHTLYEMKPYLDGSEPFVLTTVDTVFKEDEFSEYVRAFREAVAEGYDGLMGVTDYIDDEKPLYVKVKAPLSSSVENATDRYDEIEGFYDDSCSSYVSAGIYGLTPAALDTLERCIERGESRMRNFQRALVREGKRLKVWRFSKVIDVDHVSDIEKAEELICNV